METVENCYLVVYRQVHNNAVCIRLMILLCPACRLYCCPETAVSTLHWTYSEVALDCCQLTPHTDAHFTEICELGKYLFSKEKFPHSFASFPPSFSLPFFSTAEVGGWFVFVPCARDIQNGDLSHLKLHDHWMACNTSASAPYRCAAPRMLSRDSSAHWLIHMSAD